MKVTSTKTYFINGSRVRPGTVFEFNGKKLKPDMTPVDAEPKAASKKGGKAPETFSELAKKDAQDLTPKGAAPGADLV